MLSLSRRLAVKGFFGRAASTSPNIGNIVEIEQSSLKGVSILSLNRKPVNAFNLPLITAVQTSLKQLEADPTVKAVIIRSAVPGIFSAGLDFTHLIDAKANEINPTDYLLHSIVLFG